MKTLTCKAFRLAIIEAEAKTDSTNGHDTGGIGEGCLLCGRKRLKSRCPKWFITMYEQQARVLIHRGYMKP